eukprot:scaffold2.g7426.t1
MTEEQVEEEEEDEDFNEEEGDDSDESSEDSDEEEGEGEEEAEEEGSGKGAAVVIEEEEEEAAPSAKKQRTDAGPSSSQPAQRGEKKSEYGEILEGLSGDEVDPSLIIAGGRRARRGRPGATGSAPRYTAEAKLDSDEDEW